MAEAALLRTVGLGRRFGGLAAVDAVSIDLQVGEIHAVIGTNGAGKSTLVNMISGELALGTVAERAGAARRHASEAGGVERMRRGRQARRIVRGALPERPWPR